MSTLALMSYLSASVNSATACSVGMAAPVAAASCCPVAGGRPTPAYINRSSSSRASGEASPIVTCRVAVAVHSCVVRFAA